MQIQGKRVKRTRLVRTDDLVVAVEVELVYPSDAPDEPCYEPETVRFLQEVEQRANQRDTEWLQARGRVYAALAVKS
jgi:hypothetical protein